jgi:hypothetical protein
MIDNLEDVFEKGIALCRQKMGILPAPNGDSIEMQKIHEEASLSSNSTP